MLFARIVSRVVRTDVTVVERVGEPEGARPIAVVDICREGGEDERDAGEDDPH